MVLVLVNPVLLSGDGASSHIAAVHRLRSQRGHLVLPLLDLHCLRGLVRLSRLAHGHCHQQEGEQRGGTLHLLLFNFVLKVGSIARLL